MTGSTRRTRGFLAVLPGLLILAASLPPAVLATAADWQIRESTYLTEDFYGSIKIARDGVTLDCQGNSIIGDGNGRGIVIDKRSDVTVLNCDVSNFATGIWLAGSAGLVISGNASHDNVLGNPAGAFANGMGIRAQSVTWSRLVDDESYGNASDGLFLHNSSDNEVIGNNVHDNLQSGLVVLGGSDRNTLRNNDVTNNGDLGWAIWDSSGNTVVDSTSSANGYDGFSLVDASDNTLRGNLAAGNGNIGFWITGAGSVENELTDNSGTGNGLANFVLYGAADNVLTGNTAIGGRAGIAVTVGASNNSLTGNVSRDHDLYGFWVAAGASGNWLENNEATGNLWGFGIYAASFNTLTGNVATADQATGEEPNTYGFMAVSGASIGGDLGGATMNDYLANEACGSVEFDAYQDGASAGNNWVDNIVGMTFGVTGQLACPG